MCWPYYMSFFLLIRSTLKMRAMCQSLPSVLTISSIYIVTDMRWSFSSFILLSKESYHLDILIVVSWLSWLCKWSLFLIHGYTTFQVPNCVYLLPTFRMISLVLAAVLYFSRPLLRHLPWSSTWVFPEPPRIIIFLWLWLRKVI